MRGNYLHGVHLGRTSRIATAAVALGLTVAACGAGDDADDSAAAVETVAPPVDAGSEASSAGTDAVPALMQFSAPLVGGGSLDAATLANKPTAFWFWSPT